jgi:hypothetical protein
MKLIINFVLLIIITTNIHSQKTKANTGLAKVAVKRILKNNSILEA